MIETVTEEITPDLAREYLSRNARNRPLSPGQVAAFAKDIREGLWHTTHQGIAFDEEGALLDGQHRLAAIAEAGEPVTMAVSRGVPRKMMTVLDVGRKRTVSDTLAIEGFKDANVMASIARLGLLYDSRDFSARKVREISAPQIYEYARENSTALVEATHRARVLYGTVPTTTGVLGAAFFLFYRKDAEACEQFFNAIAYMRTNGEGDPRLALYRRLTSLRNERQRVSNLQVLDLFIRAWNIWREDKTLDKMPLSKSVQWRELL